jgi:dihydrofolate reductase
MSAGKVLLSVAVSLDGFIADLQGGVEWLNPFFSDELNFDDFMAEVSAVIMGRTTYDQTVGLGWPHAGKHVVVLTSRPLDAPSEGVHSYHGDLDALVAGLKREHGGIIWHMGDGRPLFLPRERPHDLTLVEQKAYSNGVVRLRYAIAS